MAKEEFSKKDSKDSKLDYMLFRGGDQQSFLEDLATLVEDGVPANKAIDVLESVLEGSAKKAAKSIRRSLAQGQSFSDGMVGWFPHYVVELVRIGEQGGTMVHNIRVAAEALGQRSAVVSTLFSELTYPLVVLSFACGIVMSFNSKGGILEQFAVIKPVSIWPTSGQVLYNLAQFLTDDWWLIVLGIIGFIIGLNIVLKTYIGPGRDTIDKLPLLSLYRKLAAGSFMETLGLLVLNGVVFKQALTLISSQASTYLRFHMRLMERRLGKGEGNIADVLDTGLIDRVNIIRLRAIAEAKGFEHALVRQGKQATLNSMAMLNKVAKLLGSLILALGAGVAGLMVMGTYAISQVLGS
ncbi:MAG: tcpE [Gammaproteobacteria bacterium]|jgi:type II secretory pathway component PulF|nr:tcpE [Gammaproteobacteria bacterium]